MNKVVGEQVALYGTLTWAEPARPRARAESAPAADAASAESPNVLPLRRRAQ